ncbi:MAG: hypothetical protein A2148_06085 [Chloroflexi bacterium RBG_16_68_14]|nr:MAG: hypothetical protein A2148_06085 [Chloroflexi bacterium RBG_16_68_14]
MNPRRQQKGYRLFAVFYPMIVASEERRRWSKIRPRIMGEVQGRVLEIGVGSGYSLPFYPPQAQVIATEPDPHMLGRARRHLEKLSISNIEIRQAAAEQLPFGDASFDHVVCSWVLCTVDELRQTLAEVHRVLKPDGTFRFMEHVRNDDSAFWNLMQRLIAPAWQRLGAGCRLNQRTQQAIEEASFRFEWIVEERGWLSPVIYGVARPALL